MALAKLSELTARLAVALLPALVTIYAIVISLMRSVLRRASLEIQKIEETKVRAREKFQSKLQDEAKGNNEPTKVVKELEKVKNEYDAELESRERRFRCQQERLSLRGFFLLPGGAICVSIVLLLFSSTVADFGVDQAWPALVAYVVGALLLVYAIRRVVLAITELDALARIGDEQASMESTLSKKLEELLGLKEPTFDAGFDLEGGNARTINLKRNSLTPVSMQFFNRSGFAARDVEAEMAFPAGFDITPTTLGLVHERSKHFPTCPSGVSWRTDIGVWSNDACVTVRANVTANREGQYEMFVFITSSTHKNFMEKLQIIVTQ